MKILSGTLTPAYSRDYPNAVSAIAAWNAGMDFVLHTPFCQRYCSIRDLEECPVGQNLQIRWKQVNGPASGWLEVDIITKRLDGSWTGTGLSDDDDLVEAN